MSDSKGLSRDRIYEGLSVYGVSGRWSMACEAAGCSDNALRRHLKAWEKSGGIPLADLYLIRQMAKKGASSAKVSEITGYHQNTVKRYCRGIVSRGRPTKAAEESKHAPEPDLNLHGSSLPGIAIRMERALDDFLSGMSFRDSATRNKVSRKALVKLVRSELGALRVDEDLEKILAW